MTFPETGTEAKNEDKPTCYVATSQLTLGGALELVRKAGEHPLAAGWIFARASTM